jgi:hypothetical protein
MKKLSKLQTKVNPVTTCLLTRTSTRSLQISEEPTIRLPTQRRKLAKFRKLNENATIQRRDAEEK